MEHITKLTDSFPDPARDIRINLKNVLAPGVLTADQVWGIAISCAYASRNTRLTAAIEADAVLAGMGEAVLSDAKAAAVLMGMNNVFYRFRHVIEKEVYTEKPARLRMQRLSQVTTNKADFELFCLAVSAINNCQSCMQAHEAAVLKQGLSEDQVQDAIRIAAAVHASAIAAELV